LYLQKLRQDGTMGGGPQSTLTESITRRMNSFPYAGGVHGLYDNDHVPGGGGAFDAGDAVSSIAAKLGLKMPNLAPDLSEFEVPETGLAEPLHPHGLPTAENAAMGAAASAQMEPSKKKYAKEAWPGKKPVHSFLV
jgi:nuclear inhibitor of protein phosphatase 1